MQLGFRAVAQAFPHSLCPFCTLLTSVQTPICRFCEANSLTTPTSSFRAPRHPPHSGLPLSPADRLWSEYPLFSGALTPWSLSAPILGLGGLCGPFQDSPPAK